MLRDFIKVSASSFTATYFFHIVGLFLYSAFVVSNFPEVFRYIGFFAAFGIPVMFLLKGAYYLYIKYSQKYSVVKTISFILLYVLVVVAPLYSYEIMFFIKKILNFFL